MPFITALDPFCAAGGNVALPSLPGSSRGRQGFVPRGCDATPRCGRAMAGETNDDPPTRGPEGRRVGRRGERPAITQTRDGDERQDP